MLVLFSIAPMRPDSRTASRPGFYLSRVCIVLLSLALPVVVLAAVALLLGGDEVQALLRLWRQRWTRAPGGSLSR